MFRKALAVAAAALCASMASAGNNIKVVNINDYTTPGLGNPTSPRVLDLKPNQMYTYTSDPNTESDAVIVVRCPPPKKTNARVTKAFTTLMAVPTGNDETTLRVRTADGNVLGDLWPPAYEGYGSLLALGCINGEAVAGYNDY